MWLMLIIETYVNWCISKIMFFDKKYEYDKKYLIIECILNQFKTLRIYIRYLLKGI